MTRQQRYLSDALKRIQSMDRTRASAKIYGGLCHTFPILLRTNGLCQTLAFVEDKASGSGDRAAAYKLLRAHAAATLDLTDGELIRRISKAGAEEYLRYTRILLDAWVYYKRFAVSILGVESGGGENEQ